MNQASHDSHDGASQFLMSVHDAAPGITENVLIHGRIADGRSSYELLADEADLRPGMTAVDLACGSGALTRLISQRVGMSGQAVGIDLNHAELALAEIRCKDHGNVRFLEESAAALSLPDASADAVLCHMALMLFRPVEPSLSEIARILRPSGILAAVVPGLNGGNAVFSAVRKAVAAAVANDVAPEKLVAIGCPDFGSEQGIRDLFARSGRFVDKMRFVDFEVVFEETPEALAALLMPFFYYTYLLSADGREQLKAAWSDIFRRTMADNDEKAVFRLSLSAFSVRKNPTKG
ncbi:MAG: class I SAM-dependent methyltransferase [Victivallaceae bacterium]|nr:class I SAM-dependent methyltransferase [Victivallaceae bacterium]